MITLVQKSSLPTVSPAQSPKFLLNRPRPTLRHPYRPSPTPLYSQRAAPFSPRAPSSNPHRPLLLDLGSPPRFRSLEIFERRPTGRVATFVAGRRPKIFTISALPPVNVWVTLDRGDCADTPALLGSARRRHRRRSRKAPILPERAPSVQSTVSVLTAWRYDAA
jgi:hypothetical protein